MRRSFAFFTVLTLSSLPCGAAISGTVTDRAGNSLSGVGVSLMLAGTSTTTDAKGTWSLAPTGIDARTATTSRTRWTGKAVELSLAEPAMVSVEAYDLKGAKQGRLANVKLGAGSHSLPLALSTSGVVWLRVTVNGKSEMMMAGLGMLSPVGTYGHTSPQETMAARSQSSVDTLRFTWRNKVVARVALANPDTSGIVVKLGTDSSIAWNDSIAYGSVYDARDGQVYRSVKIGNQVWMAENLNYRNATGAKDTVGVCYNNRADSCTKYGRLYTWAVVMNGARSSTTSPSGEQGLCPTGWHVPSNAEWATMQTYVEPTNTTDGTKLKSTSGWLNFGNGMDIYGFCALPGGYFGGTSFFSVGSYGLWWSATEDDASHAWSRYMGYVNAEVHRTSYVKTNGFALRCLGD